MQSPILPEQILFLDIETVPQVFHFEDLSPRMKELFEAKTRYLLRDEMTLETLYQKAGIYAEFGQIICVCAGVLAGASGTGRKLRIKTFAGHEEKKLLEEFSDLLHKSFSGGRQRLSALCAHNGKEFDFPYLCRRMIIQRVGLPPVLQLQGKKPWEVPHLDTMELWKFGDYKSFTSLDLLSEVLGIPSPKDEISGSEVGRVYWEEQDLDKIAAYCRKDVVAMAQVYLRLSNQDPFEITEVEYA